MFGLGFGLGFGYVGVRLEAIGTDARYGPGMASKRVLAPLGGWG